MNVPNYLRVLQRAYYKSCKALARCKPCMTCEFFEGCNCISEESCRRKLCDSYVSEAEEFLNERFNRNE